MITRLMAFAGGALLGGGITAIVMEKQSRATTTVYQFVECTRDHVQSAISSEEADATIKDIIDRMVDDMNTPISLIPPSENSMLVPEAQINSGDKETVNPYHATVAATATPIETFVAGEVNEYGMSYLEEEDYLDEDGRYKGRIDILMDDGQPIFLLDGEQIDDWAQRIGESILIDMYKLVPPGIDQILYVRNHRTDEDYEVVCVS